MTTKPARLFGRATEWAELVDFASSPLPGATLGLVYGRRRQGKTLLLELLVRELGGFLFAATQQTEPMNLADLGAAYATHRGLGAPVAFADWRQALDELLRLGEERQTPVVIDEFPYLTAVTPGLPSYLQQALSPLGHAKEHTRTRLILCGSALTTMTQLLGGGAPLRGRASLELVVRPFGFREAAAFWGLSEQPDLAFRVNALVGGTPAYLEMSGGVGPSDAASFDAWVVRRLLNPASAMFREGNLLLREEPTITDPTSYTAVLSAISNGLHRRNEIAAAIGRPGTALAHPLGGLENIRLVERVDDALRDKRSVYRITDPAVRLHQLIISRHEPELVSGRGDQVWRDWADTVASKIYGPHFEDVARAWCLQHAGREALGGMPGSVLPATIACPQHGQGHEIDIVVTEKNAAGGSRITAIGEAKSTSSAMDQSELLRLDHLRALLPSDRVPHPPRLLLFARAGFSPALRTAAAARDDVELVDLERLYTGS